MRIPPAPLDGPHAPVDALERISAIRSADTSDGVLLLYQMLLHSPEVAAGWCELGTAVRWRASLDGRTRELLICLVASLNDDDYEWAVHAPLALAAGVGSEQLDSLPAWSACDSFSERDRVALGFGERVALGRVDDETFPEASATFDRQQLVEIAATCAYYVAVSRFLRTFDVRADDERG